MSGSTALRRSKTIISWFIIYYKVKVIPTPTVSKHDKISIPLALAVALTRILFVMGLFTVIAETIDKELRSIMYMAIIYPNVVNHIRISVSDLEKAIDFYREIFGFNIIKGPINIVSDTPGIGLICKNIFGPRFKEAKIVWLSSGNNIGLEILQFIDPKAELRSDNFEYWKSGFFHVCITNPNIGDLCNKISEKGGKLRADIQIINEAKQHKIAYCEDPFGNIIEIFTYSYEQVNANTY